MVYRGENSTYDDLRWIRRVVRESSYPEAEIHVTEWNSSPSPRDLVHDTAFMAPFILLNNLKSLGLVDSLGYWTFTDVFEEQGAGDTAFHGGFGLINAQGLKKASYYGYWFLNKLGAEVLASGENYFITRKEGGIQILLWNYCRYNAVFFGGDQTALTFYDRYSVFNNRDSSFQVTVEGLKGNYEAVRYVLGREHGSAFDVWLKNGAPPAPGKEEMEVLKRDTGPEGGIGFLKDAHTFSRNLLLKPHDAVMIELKKES